MPNVSDKFATMCYDHPNMREFVFSCKGRPFAMMSSEKIPVPSLTLIDFNLVQDLGIKMTEIQCSKFTFAGIKLRILGKIHQTVQCVKNGKLKGNVHIKANVVENLSATFDSHSIAGTKMVKFLSTAALTPDPPTRTPSFSTTTPMSPTKNTRSCCPCSAPVVPSTPPTPSPPSTPTFKGRSSPPGFPPVPQYRPEPVITEPTAPVSKPPIGSVRRLQLRPGDSAYRDWYHGRVTKIRRPGLAWVDVLRLEGDPFIDDEPIYGDNVAYSGIDVAVNDVVLFRGHSRDPDLAWAEARPHIYVVYNDEEVRELQHHGVEVPECPPENLPAGYYG